MKEAGQQLAALAEWRTVKKGAKMRMRQPKKLHQ